MRILGAPSIWPGIEFGFEQSACARVAEIARLFEIAERSRLISRDTIGGVVHQSKIRAGSWKSTTARLLKRRFGEHWISRVAFTAKVKDCEILTTSCPPLLARSGE
jgi:hypothetical protein